MNIFGRITLKFVRNKRLSTILLFALTAWGILSFSITPKQYNPDIVAPAFSIRVDAPGSTVREVYELVTKPLENVLKEIPGVEDVYSRSVHGGASFVQVRFFVGEDLEKSMIRLRQKIDSNLDLKPVGARDPDIKAVDPEDLPIMTVALLSDSLTSVELRRAAFRLKDDLKMVDGISIIDVVGGQKREFPVVLDPAKLLETKADIREVSDALDRTSVLRELGPVKGVDTYHPVELSSTVNSVEEIRNLVIAANISYSLKVAGLGETSESVAEQEAFTDFVSGGRRLENAVFLSIAKKKGENIAGVSGRLEATIEELSARAAYLTGVRPQILRNEGRVAAEEIHGLTMSLAQAVAIVFAVLFLFLNARAALIVAMSVPLTLLAVFGLGYLGGYTINRITLFALILSLGLLVDSATVVVENIVRNKKLRPRDDSAVVIAEAVAEVGSPLFLSTLTTVLAFIPMAFVTGMMGPYMGPIPFFVPAALGVALVLAYTLNPFLASVLCSKDAAGTEPWVMRVFARVLGRAGRVYEGLMNRIIRSSGFRRTFLLIGAALVIVAVAFPAVGFVRFRMLPKADREQIYVYMDLSRGTSSEKTRAVAADAAVRLEKDPEVTSVQVFTGMPPILDFNGMFRDASSRAGTHQATLRLNLTHPDGRDAKSEDLAIRYRTVVRDALAAVPGAAFGIIEDPPGPPVQATFLVKVKGTDDGRIRRIARELEGELAGIRGLVDLDTTMLEPLTQFIIEVDREKAAVAKVSTAHIARALEVFYRGGRIGVYHDERNLEQEYIVLKFPRTLRQKIEGLRRFYLTNELGNSVPVLKFLTVREIPAEPVILGDNRREAVYISGEMERRSAAYASMDALMLLAGYRPKVDGAEARLERLTLFGATYQFENGERVRVELGGEWKLTLEVFRDLGLAMAVAVLLIYFVMVVQFNSYLVPLLILGTIPLSLVGVMPGFALLFLLDRVYFSATSMIGVIALSGIVVNNAIILMEYIQQLSAEKKAPYHEVIVEACKIRVRPIVLTSLTTVLGTLMIASDPVWAGLAWSVVFGLSLSALLTLVFFPALVVEFLSRPAKVS
ncbi:MAG: efflux RND transporter permease subunit [Candidatus Omnitrophica bacterium]|nr:efflux RND transporter permease subunit [Candidatus Omnitrophota bacterium]